MKISFDTETGEYIQKLGDTDEELSEIEIENIMLQAYAVLIAVGAKNTYASEELQKYYIFRIADTAINMLTSYEMNDAIRSDDTSESYSGSGS